jgi:hypothetical protein
VPSGDGDRGGVAAEAAGGLGADDGAVFEFAASLRVVGEGGGVDVDDEPRPPGRPCVALRVVGVVGEFEQRFHLLGAGRLERRRCLCHRRRWWLAVVSTLPADARAGGIQGPDQERAVLRRRGGRAGRVSLVVPVVADVLERVLASGLGGADPFVDAQRACQLGGGQRAREPQELFFARRRRHAGERAHLRVGELAALERRPDHRQGGERAGDPHHFGGLPVADAEPPRHPTLERLAAALGAAVVVGQQTEPPGHGRVHVRLLLGELRFERPQLRVDSLLSI